MDSGGIQKIAAYGSKSVVCGSWVRGDGYTGKHSVSGILQS